MPGPAGIGHEARNPACSQPYLPVHIQLSIFSSMKALRFLGDSLRCLRDFPEDAPQDAGYQLDKVQRGEQPDDFKPMPSIGKGVEEITLWGDSGTYRVIYTARIADAVYVLHAFQKKTQATAKRDIDTVKERFNHLMRVQK
jgi:phage-related protein